jgi:uncharacterized membrane protein (Fun14 family)
MAKLVSSRVGMSVATQGALAPRAVTQPAPVSWKRFISFEYWFNAVGGASGLAVMGAWFLLGTALGYLIKRYAGYVVGVLIGVACVLAVGEYAGVISLHWDVIRDFVHIRSLHDFSVVGYKLYAECRLHASWYVSALIGFIIGHMIG